MIEFVKAVKSGASGVVHETLEEAQIDDIAHLLFKDPKKGIAIQLDPFEVARLIVSNARTVQDVLTTNEKSRPKARSLNGGRKLRKPKTPTVISASETAA